MDIECRQQGREYVSPQREIERLQKLNEDLCEKYAAQSQALTRAAEIHAEKQREIDGLHIALQGRCEKIRGLETQVRVLKTQQEQSHATYEEALQRFGRTESDLTARSDRLRAVLAQAMEHLPHGGYAWNKVREVLG